MDFFCVEESSNVSKNHNDKESTYQTNLGGLIQIFIVIDKRRDIEKSGVNENMKKDDGKNLNPILK